MSVRMQPSLTLGTAALEKGNNLNMLHKFILVPFIFD